MKKLKVDSHLDAKSELSDKISRRSLNIRVLISLYTKVTFGTIKNNYGFVLFVAKFQIQ